MRIMIDTNVLIDYLADRKPYSESADIIVKMAEIKICEGYISALSIPNIVYILRKELTAEKTKDIIEKLASIFKIIGLKGEDLLKAATTPFTDYEDSVQLEEAYKAKIDYFITNNKKDFLESKIPIVSPYEFVRDYA